MLKNKQTLLLQSKTLTIGNRIPKDFFVTSGVGESDITVHAGSYHLALKDAGIEKCNIIVYSSILPAIAQRVEKPNNLVHGSVMETIMATADSKKGKRATAAIIFGWLYNKMTGEKYGGLVCEYHGGETEEEARKSLQMSLNELFQNGFSEDYDLRGIEFVSRSTVPIKKFGTAIVAICFTDYEYPIINEN